MKKKDLIRVITSASFGALLIFSAPASFASNFSYSSIGIDLVGTKFDGYACLPHAGTFECYDSVAGAMLSGSYQVSDNIFLSLSGAYQSNEGSSTEFSVGASNLGVGFVQAVGTQMDVGATLGFIRQEIEQCSQGLCEKVDDTGVEISAFSRYWVNPNFEINGSLAHVSLRDFGSDTGLGLVLAGWLNENSSIRFGLGFSDNANSVSLGYRYTFGR